MRSLHPHEHQCNTRYHACMSLLKWTDICTHNSPFGTMLSEPDNSYRPFSGLNFEEERVNFSGEFENWITHPIFTFSRRLVNPLLQIGRLVQQRRLCEMWPHGMETEVSALEQDLLQAHDHDIEASNLSAKYPRDVLNVNEAMYAAAFIMYHTRLKDMPFTASLIRRNVAKVQREAVSVSSTRFQAALSSFLCSWPGAKRCTVIFGS